MCKLICADGRGALSVGGKNWDPLFLFSQWWLKVFPILGELQNVGSLYLEFPLSGPPSSFSGCSTHAGMGPLLCCSWSLLALEVLKVSCTSVTRASSWHSWWLSLFWSHSLSCHHYRVEWGTLPVRGFYSASHVPAGRQSPLHSTPKAISRTSRESVTTQDFPPSFQAVPVTSASISHPSIWFNHMNPLQELLTHSERKI